MKQEEMAYKSGRAELKGLQNHLKDAQNMLILSGEERKKLRLMQTEVMDLVCWYVASYYKQG